MRPAVTVVMPVRDGLPHLSVAVASVLDQTFDAFELLIIDDGSTDGTAAVLQRLTDPRVRVLSSSGRGLAAALNLGLAQARGTYLARHDADDWSAADRLDEQWRWLERHRDVDVLATAAALVDVDGQPMDTAWTRAVHGQWDAAVTPDAIAALMPLTCCIFHATVMARTSVLREAGGYDASMVPAEDYDLWLRLLPQHRFARLPQRLYTVRTYPESFSARRRGDQTARVVEAKLRAVRRSCPWVPWPARLALPHDDRGAAVFRAVGPTLGFVTDLLERASGAPDVVAATDFAVLGPVAAVYSEARGYRQIGNLFVRRDRATADGRVRTATVA